MPSYFPPGGQARPSGPSGSLLRHLVGSRGASWHILALDRTESRRERDQCSAGIERTDRRRPANARFAQVVATNTYASPKGGGGHRFLEGKWDEIPALGEWAPNMDISETKDSLVAKVEVPGLDPKDIQISRQENLLTIKEEKKQEKEEKDEHYHRVERAYGVFTRSVRLPVAVDASKVTAS
jgi:HSP20 family molecular chaperone IbpA